jgi:hypothetical protein
MFTRQFWSCLHNKGIIHYVSLAAKSRKSEKENEMQACLIVIAFYYYSFNSVLVKEVFTTNKCATREIACGYFM